MNLRRSLSVFTVPTYRGPVTHETSDRAEAVRLRNTEIQTARGARRNQELSIKLSALYRRNVFAAGWLQPEVWVEGAQKSVDRSDFNGPRHRGAPTEDFLRHGEFEGIGVSWAMAEDLLERDDPAGRLAELKSEIAKGAALLGDAEVMRLLFRSAA